MNNIHIYLIRHGRQCSTDCNVNVPLSKVGIKQAMLVGERLRDYNIERVYSSDLIRAEETARIIAAKLGDINLYGQSCMIPEIREMDYGDMTGMPNDLLQTHFAQYYEKRRRMEEDVPIPGGESGEEVYARMCKGIGKIVSDAKELDITKIAVVSHGGAIRSFIAGILGMHQAKRFLIAKEFENTSITEVVYHPSDGRYYLERLNDYAHLDGQEELSRKTWR